MVLFFTAIWSTLIIVINFVTTYAVAVCKQIIARQMLTA